jgi:hypothetical protein
MDEDTTIDGNAPACLGFEDENDKNHSPDKDTTSSKGGTTDPC